MKILYVSGFTKNRLSNNALRIVALRRLGHEVVECDIAPIIYCWGRVSSRLLHHFGFYPLASLIERKVVRQCKEAKPHLIWVDKGRFIPANAIRRLKQLFPSSIFVHYNPDDPFGEYKLNWSMFIKAIPEYDVHLIPNEVAHKDYEMRGAKRVIPFDRSFSAQVHRPLALSMEEKQRFGVAVGFIGSWAPAREAAIASLIRKGIKVEVYGVNWEKGAHWNTIKPYYRGKSLFGDEYAKAICGMDIALHFLRRENRDEQDSRTFEIPACGSFMLAERSKAHERLFKDGVEAVFFDSHEDLELKVKYYLKNNNERKAIAREGHFRALQSGYEHSPRLRQLLDRITSN